MTLGRKLTLGVALSVALFAVAAAPAGADTIGATHNNTTSTLNGQIMSESSLSVPDPITTPLVMGTGLALTAWRLRPRM